MSENNIQYMQKTMSFTLIICLKKKSVYEKEGISNEQAVPTSPELDIPEATVIRIITEHCHFYSRRAGPKHSQHQKYTIHTARSPHNTYTHCHYEIK